MKDHLSYLIAVISRWKILLGGGSAAVVLVGVLEHYLHTSADWTIYLWIVVVCVLGAFYDQGLGQFKQLKPKLEIAPQVFLQQWQTNIPCYAYYIRVINSSKAKTIEHVEVKLYKIEPPVQNLDWLPVPLHLKHDNWPPGAKEFRSKTEFSLNPGDHHDIDVVAAATASPSITVEHVVAGQNKLIPSGCKYKFTIIATGGDVPPSEPATFEVFIDPQGILRCVRST